jgi:hypothetical protein
MNYLHPVLSTFFYFMRQWFLWYIYSQQTASTVFYACSKFNMLPSTSSTLLYALRYQVSTYVYIWWSTSTTMLTWGTFIYVFSGPSLTFIRWKWMHGYTSLIRLRLHSTSTATFREHFLSSPTASFREHFRVHFHDNYNRKDDLVHLNLPSFFQQTDTLSGLFHPGNFVNIFVTILQHSKQTFYLRIENTSPDVSLLLLANIFFLHK